MKKISLLLLFVASAVMTVSCDLGDEAPYYGDARTLIGFNATSQTNGIVTDGTDKNITVPVSVIGGNQGLTFDSDVTVTYELDAAATTATLGYEFDFPSASRTVTIPAGSVSTAYIPLIVHSNHVVVGDNKKIVLKITSMTTSGNAVLASNYSKTTVTLNGLCFSNLSGNYVLNYTSGPVNAIITELAPGEYKSNVAPGWATYEIFFTELCGNLTIVDWTFNASNPISGVGTVQPNGNLRFTSITIEGVYENRAYTYTKVN